MSDSGHLSRIGPRIRAERRDQGLSLAALSSRSGVGRATLSDLEQAARTPTLETLTKISAALGIEMPSLLGGATERPWTVFDDPEAVSCETLDLWDENDARFEVLRIRVWRSTRQKPRRRGTKGFLTVVSGQIAAGSAATPRRLGPGSQAAFAADQPHAFSLLGPDHGPAAVAVLVMRYPREEGDRQDTPA